MQIKTERLTTEGNSTPDRQAQMTRHLYAHESASIQQLAELTGASIATVRRDLTRLGADGVILRTHGGARIANQSDERLAFDIRAVENAPAKLAVAEAAFALLRPNSTILLDSGTTILQLARMIRLHPLPLTVFTNGLRIALELIDTAQVNLVLLGGDLRRGHLSATGPMTETQLKQLWFDQLYLGAGGIDSQLRVCSVDSLGAQLNAAMIERAEETYLLADASKYGRRATYVVAPLQAATRVVVDDTLSGEWTSRLANSEISLTIAASRPGYETD